MNYEEIGRKADEHQLLVELEEDTCLHCGEGEQKYCEECYQELIAENLKLQTMVNDMARKISSIMTGLPVIREQFEKEYCEFMNNDDCVCDKDCWCDDCIIDYFEKQIEKGE